MLKARTAKPSANSALSAAVLHGLRSVQTAVNANQTISEAIDELRSRTIEHPVVYVYAVDDDDRLMGQVSMRSLLLSGIDAEAAKAASGDGADTEAVKAEARKRAEQVLDGFASPAFVEAAMGKVIQNYNGFIGIELEDGASYEVETELDNPLGGSKFPAKLTFGMYASDDDPEDVFLEWTSSIDPKRGARAVWEMVEKLYGTAIPKEERKQLPKELAIVDEGFLVFNRGSGVIEMFENERKVTIKDLHKIDRDRMRLLDSAHGHTWKDAASDEAAQP